MKRWVILIPALLSSSATGAMAQTSSTNGVYGGYVGSSDWFSAVRQSAQNMAMLQSLGGGARGVVPADYIELSGIFVFPSGNPFPKGKLPDLRIRSTDQSADSVERAPFIAQEEGSAPNFYTVLKRGQTYEFSWMYYFGSKERWGKWTVPGDAPRQVRLQFPIDEKGHGAGGEVRLTPPPVGGASSVPQPSPPPPAEPLRTPTVDPNRFDTAGVPAKARTFEEQQLLEWLRDGTAAGATAALKALTHQKLSEYYRKNGDTRRADDEQLRGQYWRNGGRW